MNALKVSMALSAFDSGPVGDTVTEDEMLRRSPDSAAMLDYWDQTDTIVEGVKAIRKAGETYLPKFADEKLPNYGFRLKATKFTNIYRDIVESLASKPFEEEVAFVKSDDISVPDEIESFAEDVDGSGNNLTVFAGATFFNGLNSAIDWIFVDYPNTIGRNINTREDMKRENIRPFWSHVLGRNVLDARITMESGKETLTYIKILEPGRPNHVRIFERDLNGVVVWRLYEERDDRASGKKVYGVIDSGVISIGRIPLVPFITGRRDGRSFKIFPPMQDAADLQIELYQQESGLKFAKILTAYPMLSGNGVKPEKTDNGAIKQISVGPNVVLYAPPNAQGGQAGNWTFVEPSATSLTFLAADIKETVQQLRELGRQPLTAQSGNLTVITTAVAAGKAKSAVGAWALALKDTLENALVLTCLWYGIDVEKYSPEVSVYTEFDQFADAGEDLEHLRQMRASGDLSQETYWAETKRRRVLSSDFDRDTELERLLDEVPGDGEDDNTPPLPTDAPPVEVDPIEPELEDEIPAA